MAKSNDMLYLSNHGDVEEEYRYIYITQMSISYGITGYVVEPW